MRKNNIAAKVQLDFCRRTLTMKSSIFAKRYFKDGKLLTGLTLVELVVSIAIFAFLCLSVYGMYTAIINGIVSYRERTTISALADQYMEIARNLPYSKIGTLGGNPHGDLPDIPNPVETIFNGATYQIYYVVNYIDDPADGTALLGNDFAANDYKQVKLYIKNASTGIENSFLTNIVPKGLENLESGGAVSIKVFDAVGQPVSGATIQIQNTSISPNINLTRMSDANGDWVEVGLPNSANGYHITVSKNEYSSDSTHPITEQNPNPVKPDATVLNGQVTQISFLIDKLSNLVFNTLNQTCEAIPGVDLKVQGSKLIGTPKVFKFDNDYISNSNGEAFLNNIEWDSYTPAVTGSTYMIYGSSPIQQVNLLPDTSQNFTLILGPATENSFLAIVKDSATGNSIEGASIELQKIFPESSITKLTGGSILSQQDWSGGPGQSNFIDSTKYYEDDGNVDGNGTPSGLRLLKNGPFYVSSGFLISSTFDTGTSQTSYTTLTWQPTSQDPDTIIKFQLAANNDNATWNFIGPDGTSGTYYTVPGTTMNSLDNNRYFRYKVFLSTSDSSKTPVLTSANINYVSGCYSPGQSFFPGLEDGSDYRAIISMPGYQTQNIEGIEIDGYGVLEVLLTH